MVSSKKARSKTRMIQDVEIQKSEEFTFRETENVLVHIRNIREVFENHFDRTWFSLIIDGLPIDFRTIRYIRELVSLRSLHPGDERVIYQSVLELENFIIHIRRFLLPVIKERLGVSSLNPERLIKDKNQYLIRRFVAYTFPYNLERLSNLTGELKAYLLLVHPYLASERTS